jgi:SNF2 family DNA or RNA helicase
MQAAIFNDPRTGKTPTVLEAIRLIGDSNPAPFRTLVVAPASLLYNWENEIRKWLPGHGVRIINTPVHLDKYGIGEFTIVSKALIHKLLTKLNKLKFDCVIVDEAHYLRNPDTTQSKAVRKLNMPRRYALTGTPAVNHPTDVFGILSFLQPKRYTGYWPFAKRYYFVDKGDFSKEVGGIKPNRKQEFTDLLDEISVQRKRKEVMQWIPPKNMMVFPVDMTATQAKLYRDMKKTFTAYLDGEEIDAPTIIAQLTRLRQIAIDPRLCGLPTEGAKTTALLEYLDSHREPIILMTGFTSYYDLLKPELDKLGIRYGEIHGKIGKAERQQMADKFQRGEIDVLLCNIIAAGTGFTLDRSNCVIFIDRAWTPAENEQAEDRACPTTEGSNMQHDIIDFTTNQTIEAGIHKLLSHKKSINAIVNDRKALKELV